MTTTTHDSTRDRSFARQLWTTVSDDLRERRQARAAHRTLERELATYTTPAEIEDLLGAMRGRDDAASDEMRDLLIRNLQHRHVATPLAS